MLCHRRAGSGYSPFVWTEQIEDENFAFAPTAAMGLAQITGSMSRLKDIDYSSPDAASKLPRVAYEKARFRGDGKVYFDVVRKPNNDACYYCHTNVEAESVVGGRWLHDEDVHLRAGLACADCHRNSLDHHTVRGYDGEEHASGQLAASFSCQGCHLGASQPEQEPVSWAGRMGAPKPAHVGLPPLHFDKLTCTACHSGPLPTAEIGRQLNSITHRLGEHVRRTGMESPGILAPIFRPLDASGKLAPHRQMWPSYWGLIEKDRVRVLNPELAYELIRRPLRVRRDLASELIEVSLSLTQRKELLGEDRARVKDEERTPEEQLKVAEAEAAMRTLQIGQQMSAALKALEEEYPDAQGVFISGGAGFVRDGDDAIKALSSEAIEAAAAPYAWPLAHNVRPARLSLGAGGCVDCHSDQAKLFNASLTPVAELPEQTVEAVAMNNLMQVDMDRMRNWNQLFAGRSLFKIVGLIALGLTCIVTLVAIAGNLSGCIRHMRSDNKP
jgi:hypothetical protein